MCVVSATGDDFVKKWPENPSNPWRDAFPPVNIPSYPPLPNVTRLTQPVDRLEFDALKAEVERLHVLLRQARAQDIANNEPDCVHGDKVALIRKLAELVGVDMTDIFPTKE